MRETGTLAFDRVAAGAFAVALNVALFALLMRAMQWPAQPASDTPPLQVVWISAPPAALSVRPPSTRNPDTNALRAGRRLPAPRDTSSRLASASPDIAPEGARPLSAVLLQQVRSAAAAQAQDFSQNPLANRPIQLPGRPADAFRMREPLTAARVVAGIGTLFGGSGYAADACPELHRQVAQLGLTDSNADRRHALELAQALCQ